jgi:hypothetical protein
MKDYQYKRGADHEPLTRSELILIAFVTSLGAVFWTVVVLILKP